MYERDRDRMTFDRYEPNRRTQPADYLNSLSFPPPPHVAFDGEYGDSKDNVYLQLRELQLKHQNEISKLQAEIAKNRELKIDRALQTDPMQPVIEYAPLCGVGMRLGPDHVIQHVDEDGRLLFWHELCLFKPSNKMLHSI